MMLILFTNTPQNLTQGIIIYIVCVRCFWDICEGLDIKAINQHIIHRTFQWEGWFSCQDLGTWGCTDKDNVQIFKAKEDN